jgi:YegS/Rv2252/BmrU family lipid kinase
MEHLFIINPEAGKGKTLSMVDEIKKAFLNTRDECIIEYTKCPGHAKGIASRYAKGGTDRIYTVGGDGTLNEALNGIVGYNSSLGVIPCGSGNDFFRNIAGNTKDNIIQRSINGTEKLTDIGKVNDRYFINIASAGFDANVTLNTNDIKKKTPLSVEGAYKAGVLVSLFKNKGYPIEISIDGKSFCEKIILCVVGNGKFYGGGILPVPDALIDDGIFDICLVKSVNIFKILMLFSKYKKGMHGNIKEVSFYKGKEIKITCKNDLPVNIDGEIEYCSELKFEIIPKAIKFVVPQTINKSP